MYGECYDKWTQEFVSTPNNSTSAGNPRPPTKLLMCRWVVTAWNSLSADLIQKSFKICGLTTNIDGSEDNDIHALKTLNMVQDIQRLRVSATPMDIEKVSFDDESCCDASSSESD